MNVRRVAGNLALAACSLLACALAVEGAARLLVRMTVARSRQAAPARPLSRFHPELGWDKPPLAEGRVQRPEFDITLKMNSKGLRGPERDYAKPAGTRRVLILGDSFAEGYYVEEEATVRAVLEGLLDDGPCGPVEVLNGGTIAYSTDQEYLFYEIEGRRYAPDLVALLFFYNDLYYNASPVGPGAEAKPYFEVQAGRLVRRNAPVPPPTRGQLNRTEPGTNPPRPWRGSMALRLLSNRTVDSRPELHRLLGRLGLVEPVSLDPPREFWPYGPGHRLEVDEMWRRTEAILGALRQSVAAGGSRLVLLYVPMRFEVNDAVWELTRQRYRMGPRWDRFVVFDRLKAACDRLGIPMVDPREALRRAEQRGTPAYYTRDVHWTAVGNAVAAHELLPRAEAFLACRPAGQEAGRSSR